MRKLDFSGRLVLAHILSSCLLLEHPPPLADAFRISATRLFTPTSIPKRLLRPHLFLAHSKDEIISDPEQAENNYPEPFQSLDQPIPTNRPPREPDSPDRALSIVSELKSNAALFAAFAYGGLSIPSTLTLSESKVTSVTTSISTNRPLPGNDLIESFVVLDTVTLCLMISCVAASQLLIYRLTDGSWYDYLDNIEVLDKEIDTVATSSASSSAMGRLVTDYGLEFTVARTTFDLGLLALLLAVGVRAIAIFEASISGPIVILLAGTCILLATAYLQSYIKVFRRLEGTQPTQQLDVAKSSTYANILMTSSIVIAAISAVVYSGSQDATQTTTTDMPQPKLTITEQLRSYSSAAGESKLKSVVNIVAEERATRVAVKVGTPTTSGRKVSKMKEKASSVSKEGKEVKSSRRSSKTTSSKGEDTSKSIKKEKAAHESKSVDKPPSKEDSGFVLLEDETKSVEAKSSD